MIIVTLGSESFVSQIHEEEHGHGATANVAEGVVGGEAGPVDQLRPDLEQAKTAMFGTRKTAEAVPSERKPANRREKRLRILLIQPI